MKGDKKVLGFTVIEFAIVVTISGVVMAWLAQTAVPYVSDYRYRSTVAKMTKITSALNSYTDVANRLPFPSDPTMSMLSNPNAGCECGLPCTPLPSPATASAVAAADQTTQANCAALLSALPMGGCTPSGGICKVPGTHHTASNPDPDPTHMDPAYIGGIPYKSITTWINNAGVDNAALEDTLDAWNFQMNYAVSSGSASSTSYEQGAYGVIDVKAEPKPDGSPGPDFTPPVPPSTTSVGAINYIIIAAGDNHMGAYTSEGTMPVPCAGPTLDVENCNKDSNFISGIRSVGTNDINYFDDYVAFSSFSISMLWDFTPTAKTTPAHSTDIYNLNPGNVGVGFSGSGQTPKEELEVCCDPSLGGTPNTISVSSGDVIASQICDYSNPATCWSPNLLAGPTTGTNPSNNWCPTAPPGFVNVVTGFVNGSVTDPAAKCLQIPLISPPVSKSCPAGHFVTGFSQLTGLLCN